jgi:hypothetical protein
MKPPKASEEVFAIVGKALLEVLCEDQVPQSARVLVGQAVISRMKAKQDAVFIEWPQTMYKKDQGES